MVESQVQNAEYQYLLPLFSSESQVLEITLIIAPPRPLSLQGEQNGTTPGHHKSKTREQQKVKQSATSGQQHRRGRRMLYNCIL